MGRALPFSPSILDGMSIPAAFEADSYVLRRKFLKILGASFHVRDGSGNLLAFCAQKAFKLKEDIRVFEDEEKTKPLLTIQARQAIDFSACYDIVDATSGVKVGAARRKGMKSILRDSWEVLDADDHVIDKLEEDSAGMALARRFLSNLIPQTFKLGGGATFKQRFNPFIYSLEVSIHRGAEIDKRLLMGVATLIAAIEGRQDS